MSFADFRAERGLTLEQCAVELELAPSSRGWLSEIENGRKDASLRLALRIQRWSGGRVTAASVNRELRDAEGGAGEPGLCDLKHGGEAPMDDVAVVAPGPTGGAENSERNVSRTETAA